MPAIPGLRSPYDKTAGGLHHLGRMLDKIRLKQAGELPLGFERNYGLSVGLDGQLCGFLGLTFAEVEAAVQSTVADAAVVEWMFAHGLRPNRMQTLIWNEHARKLGWNDRVTPYLEKLKKEAALDHVPLVTTFDVIDFDEGRGAPSVRE
jgi:hypothetical protein